MEAKRSSLDIISSLPQDIVETILCLVPLKEAVRTSVLSKKWRYKWTTIPKLVFSEDDMFHKSSDGNQGFGGPPNDRKYLTRSCKVFYAIYQVLLLHQGPIHDFTLQMKADVNNIEIDQIITHLSRHNNTVKKLRIRLTHGMEYKYRLPSSFFLLHQLTDLCLNYCDLNYKPTLSGFGNLTSLTMVNVDTNVEMLLHILSKSPLLKRFRLFSSGDAFGAGNVTIIELFKCLPMIEHLYLSRSILAVLAKNGVPRELPTALVHLKYLYLESLPQTLSFVVLLMGSSPNLENLRLQTHSNNHDDEIDSFTLEEYSDIRLEHLNKLKIRCLTNWESEMEFVKLILAKSTVLKKVNITLYMKIAKDKESEILTSLLRSPRASPMAEIIVN